MGNRDELHDLHNHSTGPATLNVQGTWEKPHQETKGRRIGLRIEERKEQRNAKSTEIQWA